MKKSATEPRRLWIRPSICWTAAHYVPTTAGYCRFSPAQNGTLRPCQGRSGEDGAGGRQSLNDADHTFCVLGLGSLHVFLWFRSVFLASFHRPLAIRKRKPKPSETSRTGKTHPSSEWKTFLRAWPQVLKQQYRAVRERGKTATGRRGL